MLYTERMSGVFYNKKGGGANFLCLPNDPEYNTLNTYSPSDYSKIYGTEYQYPIAGSLDHNVPCAVCYATTRAAKVMIPARTSCPPSWTREYYGYLYRVKIKFTIVNGLCRQRLSISVWITCRHQWNCNIMWEPVCPNTPLSFASVLTIFIMITIILHNKTRVYVHVPNQQHEWKQQQHKVHWYEQYTQ